MCPKHLVRAGCHRLPRSSATVAHDPAAGASWDAATRGMELLRRGHRWRVMVSLLADGFRCDMGTCPTATHIVCVRIGKKLEIFCGRVDTPSIYGGSVLDRCAEVEFYA